MLWLTKGYKDILSKRHWITIISLWLWLLPVGYRWGIAINSVGCNYNGVDTRVTRVTLM